MFFGLITLSVFFVPFDWLAQLSVWQALGVPSPSIGLTRAYWLLIHGDPVAAWERNKLIFLVLAVGIPLLARDAFLIIKSRYTDNESSDHVGT